MGKINLGNNEVSAVYLGVNEVLRMYLGNEIIYNRRVLDISTQILLDKANSLGYSVPLNIYALDDLIKGMKTINLWDKLDVFYLFSSDLGSYAPFRLLNIISPDNNQAVGYGGLEWTSTGVKGNGANAYIDTSFKPHSPAVIKKYRGNNATRGSVVNTTSTATSWGANVIDSTSNNTTVSDYNSMFNVATTSGQSINSSGVSGIYNGLGTKVISRNSSTEMIQINNNSIDIKSSNTVTYSNEYNQILLGRFVTSGIGYSQLGLSCYFMGEYVDNDIIQQFRTIFNNYLTEIGLTPIA